MSPAPAMVSVKPSLSASAFFASFAAEQLEILEKQASTRRFRTKSHIIVSGEESHAAYVLVSGTACAFTDDADGNEFIIKSFGPGDCFGELGVLDDNLRTANVMTTSDAVCLLIPKTEIMRAIEQDAATAVAVIRSLVGHIRGMTDDVSCLALMDVYGRLVRLIRNSAVESDDGLVVTARFTHQDLASRVGSSREMVSKILKELRIGGYIDIDDHRIIVRKSLPDRW